MAAYCCLIVKYDVCYLCIYLSIHVCSSPSEHGSDTSQCMEVENEDSNTSEDKRWEKRGLLKRDIAGELKGIHQPVSEQWLLAYIPVPNLIHGRGCERKVLLQKQCHKLRREERKNKLWRKYG